MAVGAGMDWQCACIPALLPQQMSAGVPGGVWGGLHFPLGHQRFASRSERLLPEKCSQLCFFPTGFMETLRLSSPRVPAGACPPCTHRVPSQSPRVRCSWSKLVYMREKRRICLDISFSVCCFCLCFKPPLLSASLELCMILNLPGK